MTTILDVKLDNITISEALDVSMSLLTNDKKSNIFFLNEDCLYKAQKDKEYLSILNSSELVLSDGVGLALCMRLLGNKLKDNCNGTDFSPLLIDYAARKGYTFYFLGSEEGVAEKAAENLWKKNPKIRVLGCHSGFFKDDEKVIKLINKSRADILFVGMGVPLQEKWIARNRDRLNPKLCIGVGALFVFLSGTIKRAPLLLRRLRLEWLWRLAMEPRRLFKRYLVDSFRLFFLVLISRKKARTCP